MSPRLSGCPEGDNLPPWSALSAQKPRLQFFLPSFLLGCASRGGTERREVGIMSRVKTVGQTASLVAEEPRKNAARSIGRSQRVVSNK